MDWRLLFNKLHRMYAKYNNFIPLNIALSIHRYYLVKKRLLFIGRNVTVGKDVRIWSDRPCGVQIGDNTTIDDYAIIRNAIIGRNCYIGRNSTVKNCKIGMFCTIAWNGGINPGTHPAKFITTSTSFFGPAIITGESENVIIGNDVWTGCNSVIQEGVTIGDGAIIGSGAIVTKNVPPYAIVGGVPAKIIKYRFDEKIIDLLLQLKWWEMPATFIDNNIDLFLRELTIDSLHDLNDRVINFKFAGS